MSNSAKAYLNQKQAGFPLLRFAAPIESEFAGEYRDRRLLFAKVGLRLAALIYLIFLGVQLLIEPPETRMAAAAIRGGVVAGFLLISWLISRVSPTARDVLMILAYCGMALGVTALGALHESRGQVQHYEGLIFVCFHCFMFGGFFFRTALFCSLSLLFIYGIGASALGTDSTVLGYNLLFLTLTIAFAAVAAYMLEHAEREGFLNRRLLALTAQRDQLTDLASRSAFNRHLNQRLRRAAAGREGYLVLMLVDIDYFKQLNDSRGHATGDKCLQLVAGILKDVVGGKANEVARWGGDELIAVMPLVDRAGLDRRLEELRQRVIGLDMSNPGSAQGSLSVSVGALIFDPRERDDETTLLQKVDIALYQAKNAGRNCVNVQESGAISSAELEDPDMTSPRPHLGMAVTGSG